MAMRLPDFCAFFRGFCCFVFRFIDKGLGFRVIIVRTGEAGWIEKFRLL